MHCYIYDGSFEGFLSVIFEIYRSKIPANTIVTKLFHSPSLLENPIQVESDPDHAARVYQSLETKTGNKGSYLYKAFLSELPEIEILLYKIINIILQSNHTDILENFTDPSILKLKQINKKMDREIHRMHAFVRFEKSETDVYLSAVEPDFNVLPLIGDHFEKRFADQQWLIFDRKRNYGIYYDLEIISFVPVQPKESTSIEYCEEENKNSKEQFYQNLWKAYFDSVNITERKNTKLHIQKLPRRYWKYLPEK